MLCVVCFVGLPLLGSQCALASFLCPAWPLAAPWWLLPPPPFVSRGFRCCLSVLGFFFPFVVRPLCRWLSPVSGPGCPGPWRCVLFVLLASRFSALRALSPCLCVPPRRGCSLVVAAPPPPPVVSRGFRQPKKARDKGGARKKKRKKEKKKKGGGTRGGQTKNQERGNPSPEGAEQSRKTERPEEKGRRTKTRPGGRPARLGQEGRRHAHTHGTRAWRPATRKGRCRRPHKTAPVHRPSPPSKDGRYGKPDASVTGSTHANHRSASSPRPTPEGPARENPIAGPQTATTQSKPSVPASAGASGRHIEPGSRPASTRPAQPPSKSGNNSPRDGERHHGVGKANRSTKSDRTGRGAVHHAGPRGRPERDAAGQNRGTRTGAMQQRTPGPATRTARATTTQPRPRSDTEGERRASSARQTGRLGLDRPGRTKQQKPLPPGLEHPGTSGGGRPGQDQPGRNKQQGPRRAREAATRTRPWRGSKAEWRMKPARSGKNKMRTRPR